MVPSCATRWLVAAGKSIRLSLCSASGHRTNFDSVVEHHAGVRMCPAFGKTGLKGSVTARVRWFRPESMVEKSLRQL